jgi:hypothetical protein
MRRLIVHLGILRFALVSFFLSVPCFSQTVPQWKQFSAIVGHFSVLMPDFPGNPKIDAHGSGSRGAYSFRIYTLYSGKGDQTVLYAVGYLDYASPLAVAAPQNFLDAEVNSILQDSHGKLEAAEKINYSLAQPFPGRELHLSADKLQLENYSFTTASLADQLPPGLAQAGGKPGSPQPRRVAVRMFLVNHRLYVLFCMSQGQNFELRAARRFLQSFQLYSPFLVP